MISELLRSMLASKSHEVLVAKSGVEGLRLFQEKRPRFTLLDFQPPGMDGLHVLAEIRKADPFAAVIMLDGGVSGTLKVEAWKLGALDFTKTNLPLTALSNALARAMLRSPRATDASQKLQESGALSRQSSITPPVESIMIVDDEPSICTVISEYFTKRGYRVLTAENGLKALSMVKLEAPKLIIIDINMPIMDGLALVRELRANKYAGGILGLTGLLEADKLQELLDLGAFDVMQKPVNMERMELAVNLGCVLAS
jgi:DNA-binding response OmpR family regulator